MWLKFFHLTYTSWFLQFCQLPIFLTSIDISTCSKFSNYLSFLGCMVSPEVFYAFFFFFPPFSPFLGVWQRFGIPITRNVVPWKRTNVEGAKTNSQQVPCLPEVVTVYTEVLINKKLPAVHQLMAPLLAFRKKETKHDTLFNCLNIRRQTKRHSNLQGT